MIQELISGIVSQMTANGDVFSFLHAERDWQNLEADEDVFPGVYLDMPVKFTPVMLPSGHIDNTFNCTALFLYKSELDQTPGQKYSTLAKAMNARRQFQILLSNDTDNVKSLTVGECFQVQNLFDANLDGVVMPFTVVVHNVDAVCENSTPSIGSIYSIKDADGEVLYSGTLSNGENLDQTIQNSFVTNSNASYNEYVLAEGILELPNVSHIDSDGTPVSTPGMNVFVCTPTVHGDAHYIITDTDGNILYQGDIAENDTLNQTITDSSAVLKDTLGATLSTTPILAQGTANITAPDGTVVAKDTSGTILHTVTIESGSSVDQTISDSTAVLKTTGGATISTNAILAEASEDIVAPDATYLVEYQNGTDIQSGSIVSGGSVVVTVTDPVVASVGIKLMKTNQTISYRTGDDGDLELGRDVSFFQLAANNPFANARRFTGTTGGYQIGATYYTALGVVTTVGVAFPDNIMVDWSTYDGSTVLAWYFGAYPIEVWNTAIDNAIALTVGSFVGWRIPNAMEGQSIQQWGGNAWNYPPLNDTTRSVIWTSTTSPGATSSAVTTWSGGDTVGRGKTSTSYSMRCRTMTVTGTTLS